MLRYVRQLDLSENIQNKDVTTIKHILALCVNIEKLSITCEYTRDFRICKVISNLPASISSLIVYPLLEASLLCKCAKSFPQLFHLELFFMENCIYLGVANIASFFEILQRKCPQLHILALRHCISNAVVKNLELSAIFEKLASFTKLKVLKLVGTALAVHEAYSRSYKSFAFLLRNLPLVEYVEVGMFERKLPLLLCFYTELHTIMNLKQFVFIARAASPPHKDWDSILAGVGMVWKALSVLLQ